MAQTGKSDVLAATQTANLGYSKKYLAEPFMQEAKMRQEETQAKPGEQAHRRALPNLVKPTDPIDTAAILAEKGGISKGTMQDAITVDKLGTAEQKKSVVNGKSPVKHIKKGASRIRTGDACTTTGQQSNRTWPMCVNPAAGYWRMPVDG